MRRWPTAWTRGQRKRSTAHPPDEYDIFSITLFLARVSYSSLCLDVFLTKPKMFSFDINTSYLQPVIGFPVNGAHGTFSDCQSSLSLCIPTKATASCVTGRWVEGLGERTSRPLFTAAPALLGGGPALRSPGHGFFLRALSSRSTWITLSSFCDKMPKTHTQAPASAPLLDSSQTPGCW